MLVIPMQACYQLWFLRFGRHDRQRYSAFAMCDVHKIRGVVTLYICNYVMGWVQNGGVA